MKSQSKKNVLGFHLLQQKVCEKHFGHEIVIMNEMLNYLPEFEDKYIRF